MINIDSFLERLGLNPDELYDWEKQSVERLSQMADSKKLSVEDIKDHIRWMIRSVEKELLKTKSKRKEIYLKARLANYILLEKMVVGPKEYQRQLNQYLDKIAEKAISKKEVRNG